MFDSKRVRESGMPGESMWATFFDTGAALDRLLGPDGVAGDLVEFGCGYGTFTIPAALRTRGTVTALDIEPEMVICVKRKVEEIGLTNVRCVQRDIIAEGTGLANRSQAHALIFNLLHLECPVALLQEAYRVIRDGGRLSVIHWRSDIPTPRGPSLSIRPTPDQCRGWIEEAEFHNIQLVDLGDCCPYHYGLIARR